MKKDEITKEDLFDLHKLVLTEPVFDVYKPVGHWKRENNSTSSITIDDQLTAIEFSDHWEVPDLMERWLQSLNAEIQPHKGPKDVLKAYARLHVSLVSIHPFWDGNGRIARLISNLPCLKAGYPPIIIEKERRYDYIAALAGYQLAHGVPSRNTRLIHEDASFDRFCSFCEQCWQKSVILVEQAHILQQNRDNRFKRDSGGGPQ